MNIKNNFEDEILLSALGISDSAQNEKLKSHLKLSGEEERKKLSVYNDIVSLLPEILLIKYGSISPQADVKNQLMKKIHEKQSLDSNIRNQDFNFIYSDSKDWIQHPVKGIHVKQLSANQKCGYIMLLMRVAAGTTYPAHIHNGAEECFVIEGDVIAEGKILGPGDFHHAEPGSRHDSLFTKSGCTLLLVIDKDDF